VIEELDLDKKDPMAISQLDDSDRARIAYLEKVSGPNVDQLLKDNLMELMNMGFIDFEKNLMLLEKNHNNLEVVCSKMFE
jgi:hypothetical protein